MTYSKSKTVGAALVYSLIFTVGASAAGLSYSDQVKKSSNAGLAYEAARQAKNSIDACGFKVADFVWQSARKNKSWASISPEIQKISGSEECQSSSENLSVVADEISKRNNSLIDDLMSKFFPKNEQSN